MDTKVVGLGKKPLMRVDDPLIEAQLLAQQLRQDLAERDTPGSFLRRMKLVRKLHYYIEKTEELRLTALEGEANGT